MNTNIRMKKILALLICLSFSLASGLRAEQELPAIVGRWDIVVHDPNGDFPSWLEVTLSGRHTLVGRFVAAFGSSRPVSQVFMENDKFNFSLPVQFENLPSDQWMKGTFVGDKISGTTLAYTGRTVSFEGQRAPTLARNAPPVWGEPIELFDGKTLNGWHPRNAAPNRWIVKDGVLINQNSGTDLVSTRKFTDFKVHAEFRYPPGSNSGIYLRGRYEAQIEDNFGETADSHRIGGIYGFLQPKVNAAKKAGEWQTYDITLVGRFVTVALNGVTVITEQEIPGITGGALDSNEGEPGPFFVQGDHGPVEFRKFVVTPAR